MFDHPHISANSITVYSSRAGDHLSLPLPLILNYANELVKELTRWQQEPLSQNGDEQLFTYRVPALTPDGCSRLDGVLLNGAFDLRPVLGFDLAELARREQIKRRLTLLDRLVEKVQRDVEVDWLGFYEKHHNKSGEDVLVKLAYRGAPSRAEFPLTKDFAKQSNNSTVGITGKGVVINDIERYLWEEGGPYYQCDSKVLSEVCLPVFAVAQQEAASGALVGIIDAESFERDHFQTEETAKLIACALVLSGLLGK